MAGTITVPSETLIELIRGYCRSFDEHGFKHIVLAANEDLVRQNETDVGHEEEVTTSRLLSKGFKEITGNGVLGNPQKGTREAGEIILDTVTTASAEQIEIERDAV